jgi:predicted AlkP superfamily pyrophosphatase or phosphodiesterase
MAERIARCIRCSRLTSSLAALVILSSAVTAAAQVPGVRHVVIVGVDGLSPDGIRKAATPTLHRMMESGTSTLHARAVMPTVSSPNWASMIMGAGPEQHGVTTNDWQPDKFEIAPTATGPGGMFPTIFGVLRAQRPGAQIGCFHDWDGFSRLFERKAADVVEHCKGPVQTTEHAIAYLKAKRPDFTFIHLDHVDDAGHTEGHGTPAYYKAVAEADRLIGLVLQALGEIGIAEQTIVLVTSDHGGKGKGHGGATMGEIEIPWIIWGSGVVAGRECKTHVNTYDTAATVAHIFGLTPPECWIARAVEEAFTTTAAARR